MKNIVLIGMPGCGKSTIGKLLAEMLNRDFYDSDVIIETEQQKSIPQIFFDNGEPFFRALEADVIKRLSMLTNVIVATGGGAVMNDDNIKNLKTGSMIVFINRPLDQIFEDIETDKRPLLKDGKDRLYDLFDRRLPIYRGCADIEIENIMSLPEITRRIVSEVQKHEDTCN